MRPACPHCGQQMVRNGDIGTRRQWRCRPCRFTRCTGIEGWDETRLNAKLTEDDVRLIRELRAVGVSVRQIAMKFELAWTTTQKILEGKTWRRVV
jgi:transposase-like protein